MELGCGSASKTGTLLDELLSRDGPAAVRFAGVDCSAAALDMAQASLIKSCSGLRPQNIELICAEYNDGATRPHVTSTAAFTPHAFIYQTRM